MKLLFLLLSVMAVFSLRASSKDLANWNLLNQAEERVIVQKGTEPPFSGKFHSHHETGIYTCRRCNAHLYRSADKFDSHCGWPSFDDEIPGAIRRQADADGQRVEILCSACNGHLGHVFSGEGLTPKNTRHCVNSLAMAFIPATKSTPESEAKARHESAYFAGGCFWGVEYYFRGTPGVISTAVGFMGGTVPSPTYQQVCESSTGHAEVLQVEFDPGQVSFEELARLFFEIHDPTQQDRQGPDIGDQYRSEVFFTRPGQKEITEILIGKLRGNGLKVATKVTPATTFWPAEEYHQNYYGKTGKHPYCHTRVKRF
jgi:peptide methionine sulfoxide reductase msrA/msrB